MKMEEYAASVMEQTFDFSLPQGLAAEFAAVLTAEFGEESLPEAEQILEAFRRAYTGRKEPIRFKKCTVTDLEADNGDILTRVHVTYRNHGEEKEFDGAGNGPVDAMQRGLEKELGIKIKVQDYREHAMGTGSGAQAAAYILLQNMETEEETYGAGISSSITRSAFRALFSAVNRLYFM